MSFSRRLVEALEYARLSHEKLADALGRTRGAVNHWAHGRRTPDHDTMSLIAAVLGVRAAWLVFGDGNMIDATSPPPPSPRARKPAPRKPPRPRAPKPATAKPASTRTKAAA